jgi:nucleotidyltransferase substrate binding protein (TIGR01987 family)
MSNTDEIRWRQRLDNFLQAMGQLNEACMKRGYTKLERAGLIQTFEFTFELARKTLKALLFYQGFNVKSPRETIRQAFEAGLLSEDDTETLLDALNKRNLLTHTYQEKVADEAEHLIKEHYWPALQHLADHLTRIAAAQK